MINILYVLMLGGIGGMMAKESWGSVRATRSGKPLPPRKRRHHPLVANLPMRWRFYRSGLYISPLAPLILGFVTGIMTMLLGVGGGFIMMPAMLYLLGMGAQVVVGTSLFQILFVTMSSTMMHSLTTKAVDIVLAVCLLLGSVSRRPDRCTLRAQDEAGIFAACFVGNRAGRRHTHGAGAGLAT